MTKTSFEDRCNILSELWMNYRNDQNFNDFISYNDLGLPLAYAIQTNLVKANKGGIEYINETFDLLLSSLELQDNGYVTLDDIFLDNQQQQEYNCIMENKVDYTVSRHEVETFFSRTFTDKQWEVLASEIESIFYHYLWSDLPSIVEDIDNLVDQDSKFD